MSFASKMRQLGHVVSDSRWWPFYLQRQFMTPVVRTRLSAFVASRFRPKRVFSAGLQSEIKQHIAEMEDAGISHFGQLLSADQAAELRSYFLQRAVKDPCRADAALHLPDSTDRHPDSHIAHHCAQDILQAPYLFSIANRSDILAIVEGLLGCKPTLSYLAVWWSYHTEKGAQQAEQFHRDVDDWRFIKLFIYLTDVGPNNGPHIYVSHSSLSPALRQIRRYTDEEVVATFGASRVMELVGRAGEGFLEDTFGIHKGQPVAEGARLIFQAVYSMFPLPYGPKEPIMAARDMELENGSFPDPWVNRLYLKSE